MDTHSVYEKVKNISKRRSITNCYSLDLLDKSNKIWSHGDDFMFSYNDHGIERLIFFALDLDGVGMLLDMLDEGRYFCEFITKNKKDYIPAQGIAIASMKRIANSDIRSVFKRDSGVLQYLNSCKVEYALESDAEEVNQILWKTFRTETAHLLFNDELREIIRKGQVSLHRNGKGKVDAFVQASVMPKRFYINQIVNMSKRHIIHAILLKCLEKYTGKGGRYTFAWVEENNVASLKFFSKYGMTHDGTWNMVYVFDK